MEVSKLGSVLFIVVISSVINNPTAKLPGILHTGTLLVLSSQRYSSNSYSYNQFPHHLQVLDQNLSSQKCTPLSPTKSATHPMPFTHISASLQPAVSFHRLNHLLKYHVTHWFSISADNYLLLLECKLQKKLCLFCNLSPSTVLEQCLVPGALQ